MAPRQFDGLDEQFFDGVVADVPYGENGLHDSAGLPFAFRVEDRRENRREREADEQRSQCRDDHDTREWRDEQADDGGHHGDWYEDDDVGQRAGGDGDDDFLRSLDGGLRRVFPFVHPLENVLQNDDGVRDEHAGGAAERDQRHHVERVVEAFHGDEGNDDGDRHGDGGDECGADIMEEQEKQERRQGDAEQDA